MRNLLKNRIVLGLVCIITAFVICFGLTPMYNDALTSVEEIVRVNADIRQGDMITERMVTTVEVGSYNLPPDVVRRVEDVAGRYADADFCRGDYILAGKLSDTPLLKNEYLNGLDGTNRAISITIKSFAAGLSGKLEKGDIVSLIACDAGDLRETLVFPELQYVEVIAATLSDGRDNDAQEEGDEMELASAITVLVSPEQARLLAQLEQSANIHAALVYRGNRENAEQFLEKQKEVLEELKIKESEEAAGGSESRGTEEIPERSGNGETEKDRETVMTGEVQ